jgi:hypothetical protein
MNPITDGIVGAVSSVVNNIITRIWPDPAQQAAAQLELAKLAQSGELAELAAATDLAKGQIAINLEEAKSTNWWVAGWRPGLGWVGVVSLFCYYVPYCLVATVIWAHQCWITDKLASRPDLGITDLLGLMGQCWVLQDCEHSRKLKVARATGDSLVAISSTI